MTDGNGDPDAWAGSVLPSRRRDDIVAAGRVDPQEVLEQLQLLRVEDWRDVDGGEREHLGPAAEEFCDRFDVGDPDRVAPGDADGVTMAAIQGLVERLQEQAARIERRDRRLRQQQRRIEEQRGDIEALRERLETLQVEFEGHGREE